MFVSHSRHAAEIFKRFSEFRFGPRKLQGVLATNKSKSSGGSRDGRLWWMPHTLGARRSVSVCRPPVIT